MSWIEVTSTMCNADDSFHSGVTNALRSNVLWAQQESRFVYHGQFQTSVAQGFSTDNYTWMSNWTLFAVPYRSFLGGPEPRQIKVIVDAKLSTSAGTDNANLQIAFLDDYFEPAVNDTSGILFYPKATMTIDGSTAWTLYSDDATVPHRPSGNDWYFIAAIANYENNALKATLYTRSIYLREVAA
jgi:hypothetical protein